MRLRSQCWLSWGLLFYNLAQVRQRRVIEYLIAILRFDKRRFMRWDARCRPYPLFLGDHLFFHNEGSQFKLLISTSDMWLFEFWMKWWASMSAVSSSIHWGTFSVIIANWCTHIGLTAVCSEQRNHRFSSNICEIWWWFKGPVSANLTAASFFGLRWRCVSYLELPAAV